MVFKSDTWEKDKKQATRKTEKLQDKKGITSSNARYVE